MDTLLIFGGSGSLGHTLIKKYIDHYNIVIFSRDENKHWMMRQTFKDYPTIKWMLGCIRNKKSVENAIFTHNPHTIIIASALKHIDQCENNVSECIDTNVTGIRNIIDTIYMNACKNNIDFLKRVLFISTDKACSPVNVYGMCKSISERLVIEKSQYVKSPKFFVVRYGNVLNSRGSLLPLFKKIGTDDQYTHFIVTDYRMTRFFMTLDQSVELIDTALNEAESGDTYIPGVPSYKILDIAKLFSDKYGKPIKEGGLRPGEKLFEVLINITETGRTVKKGSNFIIKPCYKNIKGEKMEELTSDSNLQDASTLLQHI